MADVVSVKVKINIDPQDILNSMNRTTEMGQEVRRIVNMANKRISRIQADKGVISPAYKALQNEGIDKFRLRGSTWEQQKETYFKAIEYLNQDTSSLGGSRKFTKDFLKKTGLVSEATTPEQQEKYLQYAEDMLEQYGADNMDSIAFFDSDTVGQYFYDMKVEEARNAIEEGTRNDLSIADREMRKNAEEVSSHIKDVSSKIEDIIDQMTRG